MAKKKKKRAGGFKGIDISDCAVSQYNVKLYHTDQALWTSLGGEYAIVFQGPSPFEHSVFVVQDQGATPSGRVIVPEDGTEYKYRVLGGLNGCDIDPIIHIGP